MYIEPPFQLPERAQSQEERRAQAFVEAMQPIVAFCKEVGQAIGKAFAGFANTLLEIFKPVVNFIAKLAYSAHVPRKYMRMLSRPQVRYHVAYHRHQISHKRAIIAQRKALA